MQDESRFLQSKLDAQSESRWLAQKQFQRFQEYREHIAAAWDDSASKEINSRYLEPNQEDSRRFLNSIEKQASHLINLTSRLDKLADLFTDFYTNSVSIQEMIEEIREDMGRASGSFEIGVSAYNQSKELASNTQNLLNLANGTGGYLQPSEPIEVKTEVKQSASGEA